MNKIRILDLFSGIGGFSLGLERTGHFETVAFCEIEEFPRKVLAKHWPKVPCYHDIRTLTAKQLISDGIAVDAICGGFPCQDISNAGRQAGITGQRSGLWSEFARLICEIRPAFVIVENVAALLGRGLNVVLGDLAKIGYDAEWHCISGAAIGSIHKRDRLWIVANPSSQRRPRLLRDLFAVSDQPKAEWAAIALDTLRAADIRSGKHQRLGEPPFFGNNDGLPNRVDRLKSLGNAIIPDIAELIGNAMASQWGATKQENE
jgi:DNA (cytosine-5)-methyltransferase 1